MKQKIKIVYVLLLFCSIMLLFNSPYFVYNSFERNVGLFFSGFGIGYSLIHLYLIN